MHGTIARTCLKLPAHASAASLSPGFFRDLDLDLANSWMIGDRVRDVRAGLAAGCRSILLHPESGGHEDDGDVPDGVSVAPHLPAAGVHILAPRMRELRAARLLEKMKE